MQDFHSFINILYGKESTWRSMKKIREHTKHVRNNVIVGDVPTMLVDVFEELAALREEVDALTERLEKLKD